MSRFYTELHDRELLVQAETILAEVQRRSLIEVFLPVTDASQEERTVSFVFPRRLAAITTTGGKLKLMVEENFFRSAAAAASGGSG